MKARSVKTASRRAPKPSTDIVHFEFTDPAARQVSIAGTFNEWNAADGEMVRAASGKWTKDIELPAGTYEYRFVVDGQWVTDPLCPRAVPNAFGETNSLVVVAPRATPRTTGLGRQITTRQVV